ncbi:MAG TPA: VanZ family protein [Burkholderiales bacterium]|nr:VanZ family protein [Burkholderiales bacterium]
MSERNPAVLDLISHPLLRCLCLALAAAMTFQLFYTGSDPAAAALIPAPPWDKLAHFVVYSAITVLLWFGTAGRAPLAVIAAIVAVGALDELHQGSIPGRVADAADFVVDVCAAIGIGAVMLLRDARRKTDDR